MNIPMTRWPFVGSFYLVLVTVFSLMAEVAEAQTLQMQNIFPLDGVAGYSPEDMVSNVGGEFEDAAAQVTFLLLEDNRTQVEFNLENAPSDLYFTAWLRLAAPSPLTGLTVTPLANPSSIAALAEVTDESRLTDTAEALGLVGGDGTGSSTVANGFFTDAEGNGSFSTILEFPFTDDGVYPFSSFDPSLTDVALASEPGFSIRLASHATDQVGHGLVAGFHERWFDTQSFASVPSVPEPTGIVGAMAALGLGAISTRRRVKG